MPLPIEDYAFLSDLESAAKRITSSICMGTDPRWTPREGERNPLAFLHGELGQGSRRTARGGSRRRGLAADDPIVVATVEAIERDLLVDGLVIRYRTNEALDGLPEGEGTFLLCSFWLAQVYALMGRVDDGRALFERLLALRNDVGLLSEQHAPATGRMLGNLPQAFSHTALVNTALTLSGSGAARASRPPPP
jgi:hypothetical protein